MPQDPKQHKIYRALLHLYPKAHRKEYGDQMAQTFDDLLHEQQGMQYIVATWLRVGRELPFNIIEEHINTMEGIEMSTIKSKKHTLIGVSVVAIVVAGIAVGFTLRHNPNFEPTTLAHVQRTTNKPTCLQTAPNSQVHVSGKDTDFIGNAAASSIIDVPAGTNVDVHFKTYTSSKATGSAIYSDSYGKYNFVAEKKADATGGFTGGWNITRFEACK